MENKTCVNGELNKITREIFCNKYKEFCKFIRCEDNRGAK